MYNIMIQYCMYGKIVTKANSGLLPDTHYKANLLPGVVRKAQCLLQAPSKAANAQKIQAPQWLSEKGFQRQH